MYTISTCNRLQSKAGLSANRAGMAVGKIPPKYFTQRMLNSNIVKSGATRGSHPPPVYIRTLCDEQHATSGGGAGEASVHVANSRAGLKRFASR